MSESTISNGTAAKFLLRHLKPHTISLIFGFIVLLGVDGLQLLIPRTIQHVLDALGSAGYSDRMVWKRGLTILFFAIAMVILRFLWRLLIVKPSRKIEETMRDDMFAHLERLSSPFFNKTRTGDLMALFVNDINAIRMATGMALIGLFDAVFMSTMSLGFMIAINPLLTLITAAPLTIIGIVLTRSGHLIQRRFSDVQESFSSLSMQTQETFSGIRVIKGFANESAEHTRFKNGCEEYVAKNMSLVKIWGIVFPLITFVASLSYCALILGGGRLVLEKHLSIGEFIAFSFYINLLIWPMMAIGWVFNLMQRGFASSKRVLELLDTAPDVQVMTTATASPVKGEICLKNCSFSYSPHGPKVIDRVSLSIPFGSSTGIIGKPGSGKTTLASLLFHLYPIDRDSITIDGIDINDIPLQTLRRGISYVPQDSFLFSESILNNICFGLEAIDRAEAEKAAHAAAVHNDIMRFSHGYETRIGERGVTLSGGQKQRIALARALMANGSILILDDALSAVDAATEQEILSAIQTTISKKTSIVIAHRISTVRRCDQIIVLDGGIISQQGTHQELIARDGLYATLYRLQNLRGETA